MGTCKLQSLIVAHWPVTGRDWLCPYS